jgi:hypothetical protein
MRPETLASALAYFGYLVIAAMLIAIGYAAYISLTHWSGIGV